MQEPRLFIFEPFRLDVSNAQLWRGQEVIRISGAKKRCVSAPYKLSTRMLPYFTLTMHDGEDLNRIANHTIDYPIVPNNHFPKACVRQLGYVAP